MKSNKIIDSNLVNSIKKFIPSQIIMKAAAYANPKAIEKIIINIYDKALREYSSANPRNAISSLAPEIEYEIHKIINSRILVE